MYNKNPKHGGAEMGEPLRGWLFVLAGRGRPANLKTTYVRNNR